MTCNRSISAAVLTLPPQIEALVEETLRMVDLAPLQHNIVGEPGGLVNRMSCVL